MSNKFLIDTNIIIYYFNGIIKDNRIDDVANSVIKIRQNYKVKTPDAIIGATALINGFDIITNNIDDFKHLNLNIISMKV